MCRDLGHADCRTVDALVAKVIGKRLDVELPALKPAARDKQVARAAFGMTEDPKPATVRKAAVKRWAMAHGAEPSGSAAGSSESTGPAAEPLGSVGSVGGAVDADDLASFAATVNAAAAASPTGRFGASKVFISHVYRQLNGPIGIEAFKQRLVEANTAGLVRLVRADLVSAMDPADVPRVGHAPPGGRVPLRSGRAGEGVVSERGAVEPTPARLVVFCEPGVREVFEAIVSPTQIWQDDPYDVASIHAEARQAFAGLLERATADVRPGRGRVLLLKGQAGSGKTHLMRAFRYAAHRDRLAHFAYLQLTSAAGDYGQYMLANVVASLEHPYFPPQVTDSGLQRLSTALLDAVPGVTDAEREAVRTGEGPGAVFDAAGKLVGDARFAGRHEELLAALLFLQRDDVRVRTRVARWLRGEDLSGHDRTFIGDLVPRSRPEQAAELIVQLAEVIAAAQGMALVLCLDQLEDVFQMDGAADRFRRVVNQLVALADAVPTAVVVLSCLDDYYDANRGGLAMAKLDRMEHDPEPITLSAHRSAADVGAMVAARLGHLYEGAGLTAEPDSSYPFTAAHLAPLANRVARKVLERCRQHHGRCVAAGRWVEPDWVGGTAAGVTPPAPDVEPPPPPPDLAQAWNDAVSQPVPVPDTSRELAYLLGRSAERANPELTDPYRLAVDADGPLLSVDEHLQAGNVQRFLVAVCEESVRSPKLAETVAAAEAASAGRPVVLVRATPFPVTKTSKIYTQIGGVIRKTGGRRVEVSNADWRAMAAFPAFAKAHGGPGFVQWQRAFKPLSQLRSLQEIFDLRKLTEPLAPGTPRLVVATPVEQRATPDIVTRPPPPPPPLKLPAPVVEATPVVLRLGQSTGAVPQPVTIDAEDLKQHMAFLGGTGSGKTTAALRLIEQLVGRGVPVVMVDRKGDLARYADPAAWTLADDLAPHRAALRGRIDVALYTPGSGDRGRPLALPVVPDGMADATETDRGELARFAAESLGGMMNLNARKLNDGIQLAILGKAIEVLAVAPGGSVTVERLRGLVESQDETLLNAVGGYDAKHYKKLGEALLTLDIQHRRLLSGAVGERLDVDRLLGRDGSLPAGRTRLAIVNTQSLKTDAAVEFWVSQFLMAVYRWQQRHPSPTLQAVLMLDEADKYLPAVRQPATKAPLESLLRRSRSAGLGILLATQSPGDLDYKCRENVRTWLVGGLKQKVAIDKVRPMFEGSKLDVAARLPAQVGGASSTCSATGT